MMPRILLVLYVSVAGAVAAGAAKLTGRAWQYQRNIQSVRLVEHVSVTGTELLSAQLYHDMSNGAAELATASGATLAIVVTSACAPCQEGIRVWASWLRRAAPSMMVTLIADASTGDTPAYISAFEGNEQRPGLRVIRDVERFRATTGLTAVPSAALILADRSVAAIVAGVPSDETLARLTSLAAGEEQGPRSTFMSDRGASQAILMRPVATTPSGWQ